MKEYIALDSHKHYSLSERQSVKTGRAVQCRIEHGPGAIRSYLKRCEAGTPVALEATGNWYWIVTEIEEAGLVPQLVHPRKAKLMMGMINKTDKLDVHGLNRLQRNGTLPTVWIPEARLRDLREVTRTRMVIARQRTRLKNRLGSTLAKYGLIVEASDPWGKKGRKEVEVLFAKLPPETQWANRLLLEQLDFVEKQIQEHEKHVKELVKVTPEMQLVMTLPGVGFILAAVIVLEIGTIERFASAERLASYAGTTPRVVSSGDKTRYGRLRPDVNRYLRWAFVEAGNSIAVNADRCPDRHVTKLYRRIQQRRNHAKAVGAVARHLAEATYYVWKRKTNYRDPALGQVEET
jgi:transposase